MDKPRTYSLSALPMGGPAPPMCTRLYGMGSRGRVSPLWQGHISMIYQPNRAAIVMIVIAVQLTRTGAEVLPFPETRNGPGFDIPCMVRANPKPVVIRVYNETEPNFDLPY